MIDPLHTEPVVVRTISAVRPRSRPAALSFRSVKKPVRAVPVPHSTSKSRARLSLVLLAYFLGVVGVVTLAPFAFAFPTEFSLLTTVDGAELATNVLLFVPLGFLYPLTRRKEDPSLWEVVLAGMLLGLVIETARWCEVNRSPSAINVVTTAIGAGVGGMLLGGVNRRIRLSARLAGRVSLEIPLMALIYLLVPLLLLTSLAAVDEAPRAVLLFPLGLLGARLISAVQRHHFAPSRVFTRRSIALVGPAWLSLGIFPVLVHRPAVGALLLLTVALVTRHEAARSAVRGTERRFERDALKTAVPYVAAYFGLLVLLPLVRGIAPWGWHAGLTGSGGNLALQMLRALEPVAALTVLGYMLAEARGRRELPFWRVGTRVAAEGLCVALVIEASRGVEVGAGASIAELVLMIGAALLGAGMYHHQRERVRWILVHHVPGTSPNRAVKVRVG